MPVNKAYTCTFTSPISVRPSYQLWKGTSRQRSGKGATVGQLTQSVSPGFLFIRMFIVIYLFVLDDSLTS